MKPMFSENLLSHYISDFNLSSVTKIREINIKIQALINDLNSGKLKSQKEEEIKPTFINSFFGDILGFNYGNTTKWQLRPEKKSLSDSTKADAALGYFFQEKEKDDVRAVIEVKDGNTNLDKAQSNLHNRTPVDQGFDYASKMGGKCKWVIITNMIEIRFYDSLDRTHCQVFFLQELMDEKKLKELLFLFHKDRFIKEEEISSTDKLLTHAKSNVGEDIKHLHIIDQIYYSLKRFDGFGFIDPNYLVTIYPFNILKDHVWHYTSRHLYTLNNNIYRLLNEITIEQNEVVFSNSLKNEIASENVIQAKEKLEWSFIFLNNSMISSIVATNDFNKDEPNKEGFYNWTYFSIKEGKGISKNIWLLEKKECDCVSCNFRALTFDKLLIKLNSGIVNEVEVVNEYAYGAYLVGDNNFKTAYTLYKSIEKETTGKEGKELRYFLTKLNLKHLHNLLLDYRLPDKNDIMSTVKAIDLDKVIYDEIEFSVDKEVKNYLIKVKENDLIYKLQDQIEGILVKIDNLKSLYEKGGKSTGSSLYKELEEFYFTLYLHINRNFIIYDIFNRYRALAEKVFKGLLQSYNTKEHGLKYFSDFFLMEAILHVNPDSLRTLLKNEVNLHTEEGVIEKLIEKLNNFLTSYYADYSIFTSEKDLLTRQLTYSRFNYKFTTIFANFFTVLSTLDISKDQFSKCKKSLLKFLEIEKELYWYNIEEFIKFIRLKGYLFEEIELETIFKIAVNGDSFNSNKYTNLIEQIPYSIQEYYPQYKFTNLKFVKKALLNSSSDTNNNHSYIHLIPLFNICDDLGKKLLLEAFELELDEKFNYYLYEQLIWVTDYDTKLKNYFEQFVKVINSYRGKAFKMHETDLTSNAFMSFCTIVYKRNIDLDREEFRLFTNLNDFERWILNPFEFNYEQFDVLWLVDLSDSILNGVKNISLISVALEEYLINIFNTKIAEIHHQYFHNNTNKIRN